MTGRILSEAESSLQIELDSGKRVKVKAVNALIRFEKPQPALLMAFFTLAMNASNQRSMFCPIIRRASQPTPTITASVASRAMVFCTQIALPQPA